ncbi:MAG: hypothetical protein ACK4MV_05720 [Beijerinckiaceae bacterium]
MRVAMVVTARNERNLLAKNILYHSSVGVTDFFIFLDQLDVSQYIAIKRLPGVRLRLSSYEHLIKAGLNTKVPRVKYISNHMVRQMAHIEIAMRECRTEGIEWLLNLDADEIVARDDNQDLNLGKELMRLDPGKAAVQLRPLEVVPYRFKVNCPMTELIWFKETTPFGEGARASLSENVRLSQSTITRIEQCAKRPDQDPFWEIIDLGLKDPAIGPLTAVHDEFGLHLIDWFVGHALGKEIVRVGPSAKFKDLHRTNIGSSQKVRTPLVLLHYNNYSFRDFYKKYGLNFLNHPDTYASGWTLDPLKKLFRDTARNSGMVELWRAYSKYCHYDKKKLRLIHEEFPGALIRLPFPSRVALELSRKC